MYDQATNSKNLGWAAVILAALLGFYVASIPAIIAAGAALGLGKAVEDCSLCAVQAPEKDDYHFFLRCRVGLGYASIAACVLSYVLSLIKSWG